LSWTFALGKPDLAGTTRPPGERHTRESGTMKTISTSLRERVSTRSRKMYATVAAVLLAGTAATLASTASASAATAKPAVASDRCQYEWTFQSTGLNDNAPAGYLNVDHAGGSGAAVITWYSRPDQANEGWCMEQAAEGGWYFHPSYNLSLCMDVPGSNYAVGTRLWVYTCNGTKAQRFSFGSFDTLILAEGNLALGLKDNGYGANVTLAAKPNRTYWR